jgi:hypothetical protein
MATKMSEGSKYSDWDDDSEEEEEYQEKSSFKHKNNINNGSGDDGDDTTTKKVLPPPKKEGPRSGARAILPPPKGKKPNNIGARSRARMKYVKPPPKGPRGPGSGARAQYRRMARERAQVSNSTEGKSADASDSEDERIGTEDFSSKVADEDEGRYSNKSRNSNNNNRENVIPNLSDDDEDSDDEDMYEHFSMQTKHDDNLRQQQQQKSKKQTASNFFDDDSDDDQFDLPDITHGDNDLDIEKFNQEFGVSGWAEKKNGNQNRYRNNKKKVSGSMQRKARAGQRVSRSNTQNKEVESSESNSNSIFNENDDTENLMAGSKTENNNDVALPFLRIGDTVDAKAKGWIRYYSGAVASVRKDGSVDVRFHDGEFHTRIPREDVKLIKRRERVTVNAKNELSSKETNQKNINDNKLDDEDGDDSNTYTDENTLIQNSATGRSNSNMTERSSPKGVDNRNKGSRKGEIDASSKCNDSNDTNSQPNSPKGSSTEPKGVKRQEMTPYNESLVPTRRTDLAKFLILPPYQGVNKRIRCYIKRHNRSFMKGQMFNPYYTFHLEKAGAKGKAGSRQLMVAQQLVGTSTCNFLISLDRDDMGKSYNNRSKFYLGKLQAKKGTDEFVLYDRGMNPNDLVELVKSTTFEMKESAARREMASIIYDRSKDVIKSRRMEVSLPAVVRDDGKTVTEAQFRPFTDEDSMYKKFKEIRKNGTQNVEANERLLCLHNRMFSAGRTALLSEYNGRANETSVKNFQLCVSFPRDRDQNEKFRQTKLGKAEADDPERVMLQLGRDADEFNVDFTYPMSFFTAFGICLTRFVTKAKEDF